MDTSGTGIHRDDVSMTMTLLTDSMDRDTVPYPDTSMEYVVSTFELLEF